MTAEPYRKQGLIREIMQEIDKDYGEKADGFYLFANDSVLDFYPKFGYRKAKEYQYSKAVSSTGNAAMKPNRVRMQRTKGRGHHSFCKRRRFHHF